MNLLISIFGGILLTVILYGLGRRLKLSNFWAAVVAAGLPGSAYLVYASRHWPGLDVVTLHTVTFPAVAVLMSQLYGEKGEQPGKMHWAPKLLVTFFVLITVLFGSFVYLAGHGLPPAFAHWLLPDIEGKQIHTGFAGVVAHGEDAAKTIGHYRRMDAALNRLGWQVEVRGLDGLRQDRAGEVRVQIRNKQGQAVTTAQVSLAIGRPGQKPDAPMELNVRGEQGYVGMVGLPGPGAWLAALKLESDGELIVLEHVVGGE